MTGGDTFALVLTGALGVVCCAGVWRGAWLSWRARQAEQIVAPIPLPLRLDPDWTVEQLVDAIARHSGHSFGRVRCGTVVVTAQWVIDSWRDRWVVTIDTGLAEIPVIAYDDESMFVAVLATLQQLAGAP